MGGRGFGTWKYKKNIECTRHTVDRSKNWYAKDNKIPASHFLVCEQEGFCWGNEDSEKFLVNKGERYAIIVKFSTRDFQIENHGTVHILFGNGIEGTIAISKYLLNDYRDLYKKVKGKSHYFLAFKIKRDTGIIMPNSFVDLIETMFHTNW